mmetsp:Transcript_4239/g.13564  ORF Transcript_4239/g.13564 Transcript_4239/m.13564 type:complete len:257 (+) Transcript_4239:886-1656(+)
MPTSSQELDDEAVEAVRVVPVAHRRRRRVGGGVAAAAVVVCGLLEGHAGGGAAARVGDERLVRRRCEVLDRAIGEVAVHRRAVVRAVRAGRLLLQRGEVHGAHAAVVRQAARRGVVAVRAIGARRQRGRLADGAGGADLVVDVRESAAVLVRAGVAELEVAAHLGLGVRRGVRGRREGSAVGTGGPRAERGRRRRRGARRRQLGREARGLGGLGFGDLAAARGGRQRRRMLHAGQMLMLVIRRNRLRLVHSSDGVG